MFEKGHMNFFNIDRCGLYRNGSEETHGCEIEETFHLISDWVKGRALAYTIPWDPAHSRTNKSKCYCKDVHYDEKTGDFFIVLWKSDTDSAGTLWGAKEDSQTGVGEVIKYTSQYKGGKVIWGRPCYYWVIPSKNLVVSIKFDHSVCDTKLFEDYVIACINNRVKHKGRRREFTDKQYVRIAVEGEGGRRYQYRFGVSLKSLNTSSAELSELAKNVTHIIRRESILVDSSNERAEWVKKFNQLVPYLGVKAKSKTRRIEIKAEASPTVEEIKVIIGKNAQEHRGPSEWDNVGFETESGITWVDRYRMRGYMSISGAIESTFSAARLCDEIAKKRWQYLAPLGRERSGCEAQLVLSGPASGSDVKEA